MASTGRYSDGLMMEAAEVGLEGGREVAMPSVWVPKPLPHAPLWARMGARFDAAHFMSCSPPPQIGKVEAGVVAEDGPRRYLRAHVKMAGSDVVFWPSELDPVWTVARCALESFAAWRPEWRRCWAHVTWEAGWVEEGKSQRVPGWHVDGFQGPRSEPHASECSALWADSLPTQYCVQPFYMGHLDPARHNIHDEIEAQARLCNAVEGEANGVYLIDPYMPHRAAVSKSRVWRNVARVTCSDQLLEDPANTVNRMLPVSQEHPRRAEARDRLWTHQGEPPWSSLGWRPLAD